MEVSEMDFGEYEPDISGLRMLAGYDRKRAAKLCHVSERTFKRWERAHRAPGAVIELLKLLSGDLGPLGWPGWRLAPDGLLYPPQRVKGETQTDVSGIWWLRQFWILHAQKLLNCFQSYRFILLA